MSSRARADFHIVAKMETGLFQLRDSRRQIDYLKDHAVPSTGCLKASARHGARARRSRSTQDQLESADRKLGECREPLLIHFEAELLRVEGDRACDILHLISNAPEPFDDVAPFLDG